MISIATEEMIKRLCEAGQQVAHREKRSTVQHKDIGEIIGVVISWTRPMNVGRDISDSRKEG